jgi:hypothetical protein
MRNRASMHVAGVRGMVSEQAIFSGHVSSFGLLTIVFRATV